MDFNSLVAEVREGAQKIDVSGVDFLAVQVNLTDMDPGVFYVEVKDGKVNVEPYEYHDRQCAISISSSDYVKLVTGKLTMVVNDDGKGGRTTVECDTHNNTDTIEITECTIVN